MMAFKAHWLPKPVEGIVECKGSVWTFLPVGTFQCMSSDSGWAGVSGTFVDSDDLVAVCIELDKGFPPIRAALTPQALDFSFLDASWTCEMDPESGRALNSEGFDLGYNITGEVPHFLALFVASLDIWKVQSRQMLEAWAEKNRVAAWKQAQFDDLKVYWRHACFNCDQMNWAWCSDCKFVWCSSNGTSSRPRCFAGATAFECTRCHNKSGQEPPATAQVLPDPLPHQMEGFPYPTVEWAQYMA